MKKNTLTLLHLMAAFFKKAQTMATLCINFSFTKIKKRSAFIQTTPVRLVTLLAVFSLLSPFFPPSTAAI